RASEPAGARQRRGGSEGYQVGSMAAQTSDYAGSLGMIVDQVAQEKGIDKAVLVETMEAAILKAAQAALVPRASSRRSTMTRREPSICSSTCGSSSTCPSPSGRSLPTW